ncbi:uncharacterized protein LTR77_001907 [Saxophila tyrrhenica]|uniref:Uncharacterized protein n=1 Tax=Saxophila tyrrhenica TaxID=1690608 RepID=A0AAV9PMT3_9PEZI|nr:hypothetical protein LTR77_001907 [Saxophila tyrrhenica]
MAQQSPPRPIRACIFDMDGLLINTEDLITVSINTILHAHGKPSIPGHIRAQLQGLHLREASKILLEWSQLPLTYEEYQSQLSAQHQKTFPTARPLPGVVGLLDQLAQCENVELALATSSGRSKFELKTSHLHGLFRQFPPDSQVLGDDSRLGPNKGKPEPDIYLLALDTINQRLSAQGKAMITPTECLVFEDSVAGVQSGRRAGMQVVWCPHSDIRVEYQGREEEVLRGENLAMSGAPEVPFKARKKRNDGRSLWSEDGWARLLTTLEDFDCREYSIVL